MSKPTELCIYGDIGDSYWFEGVTANSVRLGLKELDPDVDLQTVRINSPGGLVDEGLAIMNTLRAHKEGMRLLRPNFKLKTVVDGYAMSAGTLPMMAGDERVVALGGVVMIHDAWSYSGGNAAELRKQADNLDTLSQNAATIYATLCVPAAKDAPSRSADYFRGLMKEESYFTGQAVVDCGLATSVDSALEAELFAGLTPERMKGRYVEIMTKRSEKMTFNRGKNKSTLQTKPEAMRELNLLALELGLPLLTKSLQKA